MYCVNRVDGIDNVPLRRSLFDNIVSLHLDKPIRVNALLSHLMQAKGHWLEARQNRRGFNYSSRESLLVVADLVPACSDRRYLTHTMVQ